jgi:hypothetical protein
MGYVGQYREPYEEGFPGLLRGRGHWIPDQVANCCPTVASVEGSWTAGAVCKARWPKIRLRRETLVTRALRVQEAEKLNENDCQRGRTEERKLSESLEGYCPLHFCA